MPRRARGDKEPPCWAAPGGSHLSQGLRSEESQMGGFFRQDTSEPKNSRIAAQSLRIEGGADCCRACCEPA